MFCTCIYDIYLCKLFFSDVYMCVHILHAYDMYGVCVICRRMWMMCVYICCVDDCIYSLGEETTRKEKMVVSKKLKGKHKNPKTQKTNSLLESLGGQEESRTTDLRPATKSSQFVQRE